MNDFSVGDTVEYAPSMQGEGSNHRFIGKIERCWGPDTRHGTFSAPNTCEFRITKAYINPRSYMYPYKPGDTMMIHKSRLRRISTSPKSLNRSRKTIMQKELKALPPMFPFPGGENYHAIGRTAGNTTAPLRRARNNAKTLRKYRNNTRKAKWNSIVRSLPKQPPGGFDFEGGKRRRRNSRRK